jgi:DNA modification methylase
VLDPFLGSGTTLIETQRLGRLGIGVELQEKVALGAINAIESELSLDDQGKQRVIVGDINDPRTIIEIKNSALNLGADSSKLIILHPPYDDIIKFSDDPRDLSNQVDTATFIKKFGEIIHKLLPLLSSKGHLAIVIGDKYSGGEWIPLGFQLMSETKRVAPELILKSTIVKNMAGNRGKLNQEQLWKYRSLSGGFYIFKHEYIFLFKKPK